MFDESPASIDCLDECREKLEMILVLMYELITIKTNSEKLQVIQKKKLDFPIGLFVDMKKHSRLLGGGKYEILLFEKRNYNGLTHEPTEFFDHVAINGLLNRSLKPKTASLQYRDYHTEIEVPCERDGYNRYVRRYIDFELKPGSDRVLLDFASIFDYSCDRPKIEEVSYERLSPTFGENNA